MKTLRHTLPCLAGLACAAGLALADPPAPPTPPEPPHPPAGLGHHHPQRLQAYLGVVTDEPSEALRAQLGLAEGQGILVDAVIPGSPAEKAGVQRLDVLKLFNDQILCNTEQLATLVRQTGKGASVTLTLFRKAKEEKVTAVLEEQAARFPFQPFPGPASRMNMPRPQWPNPPSVNVTVDGEKIQEQIEKAVQEAVGKVGLAPQKLEELQKEIQKNVENAQRKIQDTLKGHRPPHVPADPNVKAEIQVQVRSDDDKKADGSNGVSIQISGGGGALSIAPGMSLSYSKHQDQNNSSSYSLSNGSGSYTLNIQNGNRVFTARDKDGKPLFDGPVNTEEQRQAVPESARGMLHEMEKRHPLPTPPPTHANPAPKPHTPAPAPIPAPAPLPENKEHGDSL